MDPPGAVIVFDSGCGLCASAANFVARRDRGRRFWFAALGSDCARRLLAARNMADAASESLVLVVGQEAYAGSTAALRVLAGLPWPWRGAAVLLAAPRPLRDAAYRWVARNRHRLPIVRACPLPDRRLEDRRLG